MRNIGTHVNNLWEVNSCCDFLVQSRRVLKPKTKYSKNIQLHEKIGGAGEPNPEDDCSIFRAKLHISPYNFIKIQPFQVEGSNNREFLHCQLLCALLVGVALATPVTS